MKTNIEVKDTQKDNGSRQEVGPLLSLAPFAEIDKKIHEFEEEFERLLPRSFGSLLHDNWLNPFRSDSPFWSAGDYWKLTGPKVDIQDRDEDILVRAEIPGVEKNDIDVKVTGSSLSIHAATKQTQKTEQESYYRQESQQTSFSRTLSLPCNVVSSAAKASYTNGVLEVVIPKQDFHKRRSVKIE